MGKLDIFDPAWLEVVFAGRNQAYGAYQLRKSNPQSTTKALMIGSALFILTISAPLIAKYVKGFVPQEKEEVLKQTEVILTPPPPVDETVEPPAPPAEPPKPKVDQIKFPPPIVVPAAEVKDEEIATVKELEKADPGQKTIEGDANAEIRIDEPVGEAPVGSKIVEEDNNVYNAATVEVTADYPGGIDKFREWIGANYQFPPAASDAGVAGRITVMFTVEKDGSLTDIQVPRDLGFGTGEVAKKLIAKSKKWKPAVQNGRNVRMQFTIPLVLQAPE